MVKIMIATYSWSGTTARLADQIAQQLPAAQRYEIAVPAGTYDSGDMFGTAARAKEQVAKDALPSLVNPVPDLGDVDLLLVGSPVWNDTPAAPVKTFLNQLGTFHGRVAPFYTDAGSAGNYEQTFRQWAGDQVTVLPGQEGTSGLSQWLTTIQAPSN